MFLEFYEWVSALRPLAHLLSVAVENRAASNCRKSYYFFELKVNNLNNYSQTFQLCLEWNILIGKM